MHTYGEVSEPCKPPLAWLEDAQLVAYKLASGEYENERENIQQSLLKAESCSTPNSRAAGRTETAFPKNVAGKSRGRKGARNLEDDLVAMADKPARISLGRGKMYVRPDVFKHNQLNTISTSVGEKKPSARKPGTSNLTLTIQEEKECSDYSLWLTLQVPRRALRNLFPALARKARAV